MAHFGEMRNGFTHRPTWEDHITLYLKEINHKFVRCIHQAPDTTVAVVVVAAAVVIVVVLVLTVVAVAAGCQSMVNIPVESHESQKTLVTCSKAKTRREISVIAQRTG
jgi:hypothetical protein